MLGMLAAFTLTLPIMFGDAPPGPALVGIGLTYPYVEDVLQLHAVWQYNWSRWPLTTLAEDVPMLWDETDVGKSIGGDSQWLLTFNEPDVSGQAMITPNLAISLWRQIEDTYPNQRLVSPATWIWDSWLDDFWIGYISQYGEAPRIDAVACHAYGTSDYILRSVDQCLLWAYNHNISDVWLTEFATTPCACGGEAQALDHMRLVLAGLKNRPRVVRYAWFASRIRGDERWATGCDAPLIDLVGNLTPWGSIYANN